MPTPLTFLALLPLNIKPSCSRVTWIRTLGLLTRFIWRRTGAPFRYLWDIHNRLAGDGRELNSVGDGCVGVPSVTEEMRPCLRSRLEIASEDCEYGSDVRARAARDVLIRCVHRSRGSECIVQGVARDLWLRNRQIVMLQSSTTLSANLQVRPPRNLDATVRGMVLNADIFRRMRAKQLKLLVEARAAHAFSIILQMTFAISIAGPSRLPAQAVARCGRDVIRRRASADAASTARAADEESSGGPSIEDKESKAARKKEKELWATHDGYIRWLKTDAGKFRNVNKGEKVAWLGGAVVSDSPAQDYSDPR